MTKPTIERLDHYNIHTACPKETIAFYTQALGLQDLTANRPNFAEPGAWIGLDSHAVLHLNFIDKDRAGTTGPIDHIAFVASGYQEICAHFDHLEIEYRAVERPDDDLCQIYVADPNGVLVEINITGECDTLDLPAATKTRPH